MSDTVIKDQKAQIAEEEAKILRHYKDKELREKEEDMQKKMKDKQQKDEMRQFLNKQVLLFDVIALRSKKKSKGSKWKVNLTQNRHNFGKRTLMSFSITKREKMITLNK